MRRDECVLCVCACVNMRVLMFAFGICERTDSYSDWGGDIEFQRRIGLRECVYYVRFGNYQLALNAAALVYFLKEWRRIRS